MSFPSAIQTTSIPASNNRGKEFLRHRTEQNQTLGHCNSEGDRGEHDHHAERRGGKHGEAAILATELAEKSVSGFFRNR
jgi:hypothetical protein